jgi:ATP-dependent DNA helicase PIF1
MFVVLLLNSIGMSLFPSDDERVYVSADKPAYEEDTLLYPPEFLHSLQPQGMPPHELHLKVGAPIMLLRNISPTAGLANGTRLVVRCLSPHAIQAEIITGRHAGREVFIPRIPMTPSDSQLPFVFTRRQFPVKPAFAMTINKSQGQTLKRVGVYLPKPCFSHGQLYVALSRVGDDNALKVMVIDPPIPRSLPEGPGKYTTNVVYKEVFD